MCAALHMRCRDYMPVFDDLTLPQLESMLKTVSKTPIDTPTVPKIFRTYTSPLVKMFMDYDFHRIIEYHI